MDAQEDDEQKSGDEEDAELNRPDIPEPLLKFGSDEYSTVQSHQCPTPNNVS